MPELAHTATTAARARIHASTPQRVADLRRLAETDPLTAQDAAWAWISRLGDTVLSDRRAGVGQLDRLFGEGAAPGPIDGVTDGMMVAYLIGGAGDKTMRKLGGVWMPWLGKSFDSEGHGENRVVRGFSAASRAVWPGYGMRAEGRERRGFGFETYRELGAIEPRVPVLVIDYSRVAENPSRIVPRIRDELVEIVPGTYLGRWLWRLGDGSYRNVAYFALRSRVGE